MNYGKRLFSYTVGIGFIVALMVSCENQVQDDCGYTWYQARPPSSYITVITVDDANGMPAHCKDSNGCHIPVQIGDKWESTIYINSQKAIVGGMCDTRMHELRHANGQDHKESQGRLK